MTEIIIAGQKILNTENKYWNSDEWCTKARTNYKETIAKCLKQSLCLQINEMIGLEILTNKSVGVSWTKKILMSLIFGNNNSIYVCFLFVSAKKSMNINCFVMMMNN